MEVLRLTVFLSLLLGSLFLLFYLRERRSRNRDFSGTDQDALRPFETETPVTKFRK